MGFVDDGLYQVKETSLDFGKIKTAALTMLNNRFSETNRICSRSILFALQFIIFFFVRADLLSFSSNNALLEFLLDSSPGVQEQLRDSRKEVQLTFFQTWHPQLCILYAG